MGTGLSLEEEDCCLDRLPFCTGSAIRAADATDMLPVLRKEALCGRDGGKAGPLSEPPLFICKVGQINTLAMRIGGGLRSVYEGEARGQLG